MTRISLSGPPRETLVVPLIGDASSSVGVKSESCDGGENEIGRRGMCGVVFDCDASTPAYTAMM